jgi:hypothetical protein
MKNLVKLLGGNLLGAMQLLLGFLVWAAGLLASSSQTDQDDDELGSSIRGGDLNFRTGKFDDGTDPAGWYGRD